jgi:hypothetical protein
MEYALAQCAQEEGPWGSEEGEEGIWGTEVGMLQKVIQPTYKFKRALFATRILRDPLTLRPFRPS